MTRMILHSMAMRNKEPERSRFASFHTQENEWKRLVNFAEPESAYLVLEDSKA